MPKPTSVAELTKLGRERLSDHVFMREMLYSEVANFHGLSNLPEDPELALHVGRKIATEIIEPLKSAFGHVAIRSAYRSPSVNQFCHDRHKELMAGGDQDGAYYCSDNTYSASRHIWDLRDADGFCGGTVSLVIPWYLEQYEKTNDAHPLAWWIRDNLPGYAEAIFFPWLCAFNIRWYEGPNSKALYIDGGPGAGHDEQFTDATMDNFAGVHSDQYPGFPKP
mgnify:FL=1